MSVVTQTIENSNYMVMKIGHKTVKCLIDTGSCNTIVNERLATALKLESPY